MKIVVRVSANGRTGVCRKGFDDTPTKGEVDACMANALAQAQVVPARTARKTKKVSIKP